MHLGVIADDFTGASDVANTLARGVAPEGGLRTVQFLGVPQGSAPEGCEAGVVSLKTRSIPAPEAVAQSLAALDWLQAQGCEQIVFKVCSTFDSTKAGNIGPVGEALAERLKVRGEGEVSLVLILDDGDREVEVKLPGKYMATPQIAGALRAVPGVVDVHMN